MIPIIKIPRHIILDIGECLEEGKHEVVTSFSRDNWRVQNPCTFETVKVSDT